MFGATAFCENAIAEQGVLQVGVAEMSGIATKTSVGVGILAGVAELSFNNTQTTAGIFISGSVNAEVSSNFTQTTENIRIVKEATSELSADLTQTSTGAGTFVGTSSQDLNFTKTSSGDIMFVEVNAGVRKVIVDGQETEVDSKESYSNVDTSASDETSDYADVNTGSPQSWTEIVR